MANELYIEEYREQMLDGAGRLTPAPAGLQAKKKLAVGAGSLQSAALSDQTFMVALTSDVACQFEIGAAPQTADADSRFLPAGATRFFEARPGQVVAVIQQQ